MTIISRRWFSGTTGNDILSRLKDEDNARTASVLGKLASSLGKSRGNVEGLNSEDYRVAVHATANDVLSNGAPSGSHESLFAIHDALTTQMHMDAAFICREAAGARVAAIFERVAARPSTWEVITADEASFLASWVAEFGGAAHRKSMQAIYAGLSPDVRRVVRPTMRALSVVFDGVSGYRKQSTIAITKADAEFAQLLEGKRIAIVGPARNGLKNGREIEGFDLVLRFNHHDAAVYDRETQGQRTDLSFYTDPAFQKLVTDARGELAGLRFAVVQKANEVKQFPGADSVLPTIRASYRNSNAIFFKSFGNALQRTFLDIARFHVREIKAFNMDMWVTAHDASYAARRPAMDPHMFIYHDLMTNFRFTKRLFQRGDLQADAGLSRVLQMGDREYIHNLQEIYRV